MLGKFWKFSTAGNTTLFTEPHHCAAEALHIIDAEQAGSADPAAGLLMMAGGEFCANACLAFAALVAMSGSCPQTVAIAGQTVELRLTGEFPSWQCEARFYMPDMRLDQIDNHSVCHLPGISHMLKECSEFPAAQSALAEADGLARRVPNPAAGVIWWQARGDSFQIMPAVAAPGAGTCNLEHACGSGTLSLASLFQGHDCRVLQPSGEYLTANVREDRATLKGPVQFLASGEVWL